MSQNLKVSDLDYDAIKSNLIAFMRSKPEFSDYDFTGSGLTVLINLLAYNTHYNGVIANMLAGESFLDTATKRETVSMHAHRLGYVPVSAKSPFATVSLEVIPTDTPDAVTLRRGSIFTTTINNVTLNFINREAIVAYKDSNSRYIFPSVKIYEGSMNQFKYVVNSTTNNQKFEIPTLNVDLDTLTVKVQKSTGNTETREYTFCSDVVPIDRTSEVYFIRVNETGRYEVYFGDDVLGKAVEDNNIIILDYIVTNKTVGNYASKFKFADNVDGYTNTTCITLVKAIGGAEPESIERIKSSAHNFVLAQNRAVTSTDFEVLIPKMFPVESVSVWGGENNDPPVYGKVFVSMKLPGTTDKLTDEIKGEIKTYIDGKKILAIQTEIVDPEYLFCMINSNVTFNPSNTTLSAGDIRTKVFLGLNAYLAGKLNTFESTFRYSALVSHIDTLDDSIISNITSITVKKIVTPIIDQGVRYTLNFNTQIVPGTISSSGFYLVDVDPIIYMRDLNGRIDLYYIVNGEQVTHQSNVGTVNYLTGKIDIPSLPITAIVGESMEIIGTPVSMDIEPKRNTILSFVESDINISTSVGSA